MPPQTVKKVETIPIPVSNMNDKVASKFISGEFSVKSATWTNNDKTSSYPRAKFLNNIWNLQLFPQIKICRKVIQHKLSTEDKFRKIGFSIKGECPFCLKDYEEINHLFNQSATAKNIWNNIKKYGPYPYNANIPFVDWLGFKWNNKPGINKDFKLLLKNNNYNLDNLEL